MGTLVFCLGSCRFPLRVAIPFASSFSGALGVLFSASTFVVLSSVPGSTACGGSLVFRAVPPIASPFVIPSGMSGSSERRGLSGGVTSS